MSQQDTVRLMRQCASGIKMGVSAIDEVYDKVSSEKFRSVLKECRDGHIELGRELKLLLDEYGAEEKEPCPIAKGMSWMKTNLTLAMDESDESIADLICDGCNMGVKNLNRFLNKFSSAAERAKDIAVKLSALEEKLAIDIRPYL